MSDRLQEIQARISEIEAELGRPNQLRYELETLRNELKALTAPPVEVEYYCTGRFVEKSLGGLDRCATVVERADGTLVTLPEGFSFSHSDYAANEAATGIPSDEYLRASATGRVYAGGRLNPVSLEKARQLQDAGLRIERRVKQPTVTYGTHHAAQV